jgi:hypothetical protein
VRESGEWLGVAGGGRRTKSYWWSGGFAAARPGASRRRRTPNNSCGSPYPMGSMVTVPRHCIVSWHTAVSPAHGLARNPDCSDAESAGQETETGA